MTIASPVRVAGDRLLHQLRRLLCTLGTRQVGPPTLAVCTAGLALLSCSALESQVAAKASVSTLFSPENHSIIVIAHRGCHEAAPSYGFGPSPENSLLAIQHCIAMGVDMVETDVHMTADGALVIMHDDTVDRTTNGRGKVEDLTLEQIKQLRLRQNLGGYAESLSDQSVLTLGEMLDAARGKITLNLDVKGPIYAEVIDAVVHEGATPFVTVKTRTGIHSAALAGVEPFVEVPFIPILDPRGSNILDVEEGQTHGARPIALELPHMSAAELAEVTQRAQQRAVKVVMNTLGDGFLLGAPGDNELDTRGAERVWGDPYRKGATAFQTDRVEALLQYRRMRKD